MIGLYQVNGSGATLWEIKGRLKQVLGLRNEIIFIVSEEQDGWHKVITASGIVGYISYTRIPYLTKLVDVDQQTR